MVSHHFRPGTLTEIFGRLKSVQFDPLKPAGSNHDLVLQSRVPGYKVGDWEKAAYKDRFIYDGWDKQASLVPFSAWPVRRVFHHWHGDWLKEHQAECPQAIEAILSELRDRGPLAPREFAYQEQRPELKGSWYGTSMAKRILLSLWHAGEVMTHSRRSGQHIYDLAERVLPAGLRDTPPMSVEDAMRSILLDRFDAVGLLRPNANYEVWSFRTPDKSRTRIIGELLKSGDLISVDVEGMVFHTTQAHLRLLDEAPLPRKVRFIAPLDHFMWDRTAIRQVFDFDYLWEVYTPEPKRKWGYYVLPVLWGDQLVARFDVQVVKGVLNVKTWHWESGFRPTVPFWSALEQAFKKFAKYTRATGSQAFDGVDGKVASVLESALQ